MKKSEKKLLDAVAGQEEMLIFTDSGVLEASALKKFHNETGAANPYEDIKPFRYEVYRQVSRNNFIVNVYPDTGEEKASDAKMSVETLLNARINSDNESEDALNYARGAFNCNRSTIVYLYDFYEGGPCSFDIFYDAWDIDDKHLDNKNASYTGCDDFNYLKSRMTVEGRLEGIFIYRDIRKRTQYSSLFCWENRRGIDKEHYKADIEDRGIIELIRQCDQEQLNRKPVAEAIELYQTGKYTFDEIYAMTNVKGWQIHRAMNKEK